MNKKFLIAAIAFFLAMTAAAFIYKGISAAILVKNTTVASGAAGKDNGGLLFDKAQKLIQEGELFKARSACLKIIEKFPNFPDIQKVQETLDDLNVKMLFSPVITKDSFVYEVQKGDTISGTARKFNTTAELIVKANNLKDNVLRTGKRLKITKIKFSIVIDKSQNILTLKADRDIFKTYRASTGKNNCTPVGNFTITNKVINPPWYPPAGGVIPSGDPKNVLGSRWLGLSKAGYGIHGTTHPEQLGNSVTEGCIRLKNSDVEELYAIVPEGTEVVIVD